MKKRFEKFLLLVFLAMGGQVPAWAQQEVGLKLDVDKREVAVGDTLTVTVEFRQVGTGNSTVSGDPSIPSVEHFDIRGQSSATQVTIINRQTAMISTTRFTLMATKPGPETIGPAVLTYRDDQLKKREIKSNVVNVTVVEKSAGSISGKKNDENPQANPDDLRDLKPLISQSNGFRYIIWPLVTVLIIGFIWWQFRKGGSTSGMPPIPVGKEAQLRDAWKKLGNDELSSKEFCLGLSSLVRECLQYRYQFPAIHSTTEEISKEMATRKASDDEKVAIEKCLKTCDRVLHADGNLTGRDNLRALCSALLPKVPKA